MKRFEVFHLISLRRILKIKWFYHVSNDEVLRRAGVKSIDTFISSVLLDSAIESDREGDPEKAGWPVC